MNAEIPIPLTVMGFILRNSESWSPLPPRRLIESSIALQMSSPLIGSGTWIGFGSGGLSGGFGCSTGAGAACCPWHWHGLQQHCTHGGCVVGFGGTGTLVRVPPPVGH